MQRQFLSAFVYLVFIEIFRNGVISILNTFVHEGSFREINFVKCLSAVARWLIEYFIPSYRDNGKEARVHFNRFRFLKVDVCRICTSFRA